MPPTIAPRIGIGNRISPTMAPETEAPTIDPVPKATFPAYPNFVVAFAEVLLYIFKDW